MLQSSGNKRAVALLAAVVTASMAAGLCNAQTSGKHMASDQDKQFLKDLGKDSNFEIKTSQLALEKSQSADVKQYARMVVHDHNMIKSRITSADKAADTSAVGPTDMTSDNQSTVDKLSKLSGTDFDKAYIQELVKGNQNIEQEESSEAKSSTVPSVKSLAMQSASTDKKHAARAKVLAKAHDVQS